jgi:hypothetical protein
MRCITVRFSQPPVANAVSREPMRSCFSCEAVAPKGGRLPLLPSGGPPWHR